MDVFNGVGIISAILFGLIAGIVAKLLMPGKDPGGCIITSLLGIVGAVIGHFIGSMFGGGNFTAWSISGFIMAVIGAIIVLLLYRMIVKRKGV